MEDTTLFRTAAPKVEESPAPVADRTTGEGIHTPDSSTLPPSLYSEAGKMPLAGELLGAGLAWNTFDVNAQLAIIDSYLNAQRDREKLPDTSESYEKVLNRLTRALNLPENLDIYSRLDRIASFARIQEKLMQNLEERAALLTADPLTLPAKKLKEYLSLSHA